LSVSLVKNEITNFLKREEAEVLCIKGLWGVGKTYAWDTQLKEVAAHIPEAFDQYSYVSLFGINTLNDVKLSIFENTTSIKKADQNNLIEKADAIPREKFNWRKALKNIQGLAPIRSYIGDNTIAMLAFSNTSKSLICFDDLERCGKGIDISDIMGLVSFLKERRKCKVVLLLNDEALGGNKSSFNAYIEKSVDVTLSFEPTAKECASLILDPENKIHANIAMHCTKLGIVNIRVIKKILHHVTSLQNLIKNHDKRVMDQAVNSLCLFCWSHYQPSLAPSIEFLKNKWSAIQFGLDTKEEPTKEEVLWTAQLNKYGFNNIDDFDRELLKGVQKGYFQSDKVIEFANKLNATIDRYDGEKAISAAWGLYHDSFNDNQEEVLCAMVCAFKNHSKHINPSYLNATYNLFEQLGECKRAEELLTLYINVHSENLEIFDLSKYISTSDITNTSVRKAFAEMHAATKKHASFTENLLTFKDSYNDSLIDDLASTPVAEYVDALKQKSGNELHAMISGALRYLGSDTSKDNRGIIAQKTMEALKKIGDMSPLNARRVAKYVPLKPDQE